MALSKWIREKIDERIDNMKSEARLKHARDVAYKETLKNERAKAMIRAEIDAAKEKARMDAKRATSSRLRGGGGFGGITKKAVSGLQDLGENVNRNARAPLMSFGPPVNRYRSGKRKQKTRPGMLMDW